MELSLNCKPTTSYVPKTITEFIKQLSTMGNVSDKLLKLDDFINRLQDEMRKIDVFKRELPLCMLLINDAIVALKNELMECRKLNIEPVFEEFIPLKKSCDVAEKDEVKKEKDSKDKMNWMSSVQLWNSNSVDHPKQKGAEDENHPRAFVPFKGYSSFPVVDKKELAVGGLSLVTPGIESCREELGCSGLTSSKATSSRAISCSGTDGQSNLQTGSQPPNQQTSRKQRRCWSPELHRRFVNALQQLGGSQAATPKQIRELMQVDGLTNDEVKSHLQKYRLHTRRVSPTTGTTPNESRFAMGNLWMAKDEYGESSKQSNSESGSPQGPFNGATGGTSTTGGDSMEDEEDDKSENYSWKSHIHTSGKDV